MMVSSEDNRPAGTVVRQQDSRQGVLASGDYIDFPANILVVGAIGCMALYILAPAIVVPAVCLLLVVVFAPYFMPMPAAKRRMKVLELERRMVKGESTDFYADLQALVKGYTQIKEFSIAEHYSELMLKQSNLPPEERLTKLNDVLAASPAWLTRPQFRRKLSYIFDTAFETRGNLRLAATALEFESPKISLAIELADIQSIEVRHHPWWHKFASCKYLVIRYSTNGKDEEVMLTPTPGVGPDVSFVNRSCDQWHDLINAAKHKRSITRVVDSLRAQVTDVESSTGQTKV